MRVLMMGPPGAGKGTQAIVLAQRIEGVHISTGDIFRANVREGTDLGRAAQTYMDAGEYVPDAVTSAMVRDRLAQDDARRGFVLDGYPRTAEQVSTLDSITDELGVDLDGVIQLVVDPEELIARLLVRAATSGRADDDEQVIRHRQDVYAAETAGLLEIYRPRGIVVEVDGEGHVDDVSRRIYAALDISTHLTNGERT